MFCEKDNRCEEIVEQEVKYDELRKRIEEIGSGKSILKEYELIEE